jgi:eukaryotic-like serine/threonine-protein kinase
VSDNELAAFVEGGIEPARRAEILGEVASCSTCRALLHDCLLTTAGKRAELDLPAEVAGYVLGDVLGAGSGGVVVRARDPVLDRDVALKLVRTAGDHALREARTLATLRHPAVVQVYATGVVENLGYVAMELVDGPSLAARIARGRVPWREAVGLFTDVAAGLAAIHAAGLVHRDVKPGNLLVDGDRLRIADFGLAVRGASDALAGTLPYLAPEVLANGAASAKSDQYAMFAALFEAITGTRPYRELDRRALRAAAEHGHPTWPSPVPIAVRRVVERGLAPKPDARFADAAEARAALRALLVRKRWPLFVAAGVIAAGAATTFAFRSTDCESTPAWAATIDAHLGAPRETLHRLSAALAQANIGACHDPAKRACLASVDRRVAALLSSKVDPADLDRAVNDLPEPATCRAAATVPAASAFELVSLANAQAALAARNPRLAITRVAMLTSGDAELVRGQALLDLDDDVAAVAAFRRVAAIAGSRDDLAIGAANGLAIAIGIREHETAAGEAYAVAAYAAATKLGDTRAAGIARRTIGWLAFQAGDAPRANRELRTAVDLLRAADAPLEAAIAELQLGKVARAKGDFKTASAHVEVAYELRRTTLGADHPDSIAIDTDRAAIDSANGNPAHARALMEHAIARIEQIYGPNDRALSAPLSALASALNASGDFAGAEKQLTRVLAIDRATYGEIDRSVANDYMNLGGMRVVAGKFDEAVALYRAGLASIRSLLGDQHPDVATFYSSLSGGLGSGGHYVEAADALGHAIELWRAHPGHDDDLARALAIRSLIEQGLHELAPARRDAEDAVAMLTRVHGPDHVALVSAYSALGQADFAAKDLTGARTALEHAIAIHAAHDAKPRQTVEERVVLAHVLWAQGNHAAATALGKQALVDLAAPDSALAHQVQAWLRAPS